MDNMDSPLSSCLLLLLLLLFEFLVLFSRGDGGSKDSPLLFLRGVTGFVDFSEFSLGERKGVLSVYEVIITRLFPTVFWSWIIFFFLKTGKNVPLKYDCYFHQSVTKRMLLQEIWACQTRDLKKNWIIRFSPQSFIKNESFNLKNFFLIFKILFIFCFKWI